ncbi:unnamed protein product [Merluccius merluccius]
MKGTDGPVPGLDLLARYGALWAGLRYGSASQFPTWREGQEPQNRRTQQYLVPQKPRPALKGLSHCKGALVFAVAMDLLGGAALLVGVFAPLELKGRDFGDLLVYTGALLVVLSLGGWVLWYTGNIDGLTSRKDLGHIGTAVDRLARNLSRKIHTFRSRNP